MNDLQIIELFWDRDETAIKAVSDKYSLFCYKIAWNILTNHEDSEECVNDTWFAAWKYIPPKKPAILSSFLGKITRGFAIDSLRKKYAFKRMDLHITSILDEAETVNQAFVSTVDDYIEEQELIRTINQFLHNLNKTDQDIFIRRYWYMDTIKDIAQRHTCNESKVKSSLFRNRKKLRHVLENL